MSDSDKDLVESLRQHLEGMGKVAYYNSQKTELITRCPYCGDSHKQEYRGHMYIGTHAPFPFHCFRCETSGILNRNFFSDVGVEAGDLTLEITKRANKKIKEMGNTVSDSLDLTSARKYSLPEYNQDRESFWTKIDYLEDRLGVEMDLRTLKDIGFVASINDVIKYNNLQRLKDFYNETDRNARLRKHLNLHAVGFATTDRNYISFRYMKPNPDDPKKRYYMESLNRPLNIGQKIFTMSSDIDLLSPTLNVVMTEGVFDLAGTFINVYEREKKPNRIYMAMNGKSFIGGIKVLRRMGFLNIDLDIYSDNDLNMNFYRYNILKGNEHFFKAIKIHYNTKENEKDFGVSKDRIKVKSYKLY